MKWLLKTGTLTLPFGTVAICQKKDSMKSDELVREHLHFDKSKLQATLGGMCTSNLHDYTIK